jgi:molybdate/tungstate transport system permease protein
MKLVRPHNAIAVLFLALLHLALDQLPGSPLSRPMNAVLFATNLYVLYSANAVLRGRPLRALVLFVAGYLLLFGLTMVVLDKTPLFILLVIAYASVFGSPILLGFLGLFVLCFVLFQPYGFEAFIPLALLYVVLRRARGKTVSRFALVCLTAGLLGFFLVLFPIVHLVFQDSAQTLWHAFLQPPVQKAIGLSLLSSVLTTLLIALWGVPLAYALARLEFAGKPWVEALIDIPILVPQSVAGIALIVLLGPGSPIGQRLESMDLAVSGTLAGLVLAQIFVASPFLIKTAMTAFEGVSPTLELASRSLGASATATFLRISLPLASRGILVGAALAFARAVSEFGCVILFASSPVSAPVLVHTEFLRAGASESRPIAVVLLVICLWFFLLLRFGRELLPWGRTTPRTSIRGVNP